MKLKGLTQKDVQRNSGGRITDGYVASIMTGRATNLSVEKLVALADGLGENTDTLFHVACGVEEAPDKSSRVADRLTILEIVQQVVASPEVTELLNEVVLMPLDERRLLLKSIKGSSAAKSKRRTKPTQD